MLKLRPGSGVFTQEEQSAPECVMGLQTGRWCGRALLEDILRLQGYQVLTATTVQEGEAARQRCSPGRLVLVIANIYVTAAPEAREGCAWYQLWRAQHPGLPFLLSGDPTSAA